MIEKFIKKPVVVEAVQWKGDNYLECYKFVSIDNVSDVEMILERISNDLILISTIDGSNVVNLGEWIIKEDGKISQLTNSTFEKTYKKVTENGECDVLEISKDEDCSEDGWEQFEIGREPCIDVRKCKGFLLSNPSYDYQRCNICKKKWKKVIDWVEVRIV